MPTQEPPDPVTETQEAPSVETEGAHDDDDSDLPPSAVCSRPSRTKKPVTLLTPTMTRKSHGETIATAIGDEDPTTHPDAHQTQTASLSHTAS